MTIDPDLPLSDIQTMTQRTTRSVVPQQLAMAVAAAFGIMALFLSVVGIYGVLAYVVAQRTREIGIRIALGSPARGIFRLVFKEGLVSIAGGLALGVAGALAVGRALEGQVFGVKPTDPFILGTVACATALVALVACVSPAHRATRIDPLRVLND
jgi:ABC-type antimicrobial peptide transport system permease subunit